jgi:hypothetical protein
MVKRFLYKVNDAEKLFIKIKGNFVEVSEKSFDNKCNSIKFYYLKSENYFLCLRRSAQKIKHKTRMDIHKVINTKT